MIRKILHRSRKKTRKLMLHQSQALRVALESI
jgi:hypothetical protein